MRKPARHIVTALALVVFAQGAIHAARWHHPLYLPGDDYWRQRIRVVVENRTERELAGRPVSVKIGRQPGKAELVGAEARTVRVCNEQGTEMLFGIIGPDERPLTSGLIPEGSVLVIPVECPPKSSAVYYVYFDNPAAGQVPDFLEAHVGLVNGDLERGEEAVPDGWRHDVGDPQHVASWSTEQPQSGRRCLKTVVAKNAKATWISTRQQGIYIVGGAKCAMRAWVKAENVEGIAGWYIHVGNREKPMIIAPMLSGGGGTYDWKQVTAEFVAPADADRASLGTVLRGTGTAWFDNVTLECSATDQLRVVAEKPERADLREVGTDASWAATPPDVRTWSHRAAVKVFNFTSQAMTRSLVAVNPAMLRGRMRGRLDDKSLGVVDRGKLLPCFRRGDTLLVRSNVPARCVRTFYVYCSEEPQVGPAAEPDNAALLAGDHNLLGNPSFEQGDGQPQAWTGSPQAGDRVKMGFDESTRTGLGRRSVRMHVPHDAPTGWRGWHQEVPVEPHRAYLLAAWVKCRDIRGGDIRPHVHCRDAQGKLCRDHPMRSTGSSIAGTTDWTLLSSIFTMPRDAAQLQIHLTMNTSGTVWYDGALLVKIVSGGLFDVEGRPVKELAGLSVWPVNPVVKVFHSDPAPQHVQEASIALARNEKETLQLALRSGREIKGVRVQVDPPVGPQGAKLNDLEVNVVGYVPIDHPTSYFHSKSPPWHRKYPAGGGRCDGWPGMWPDPLLPRDTIDLAPNATQPIWITVAAGKEVPPGDYAGRVRLACGDDRLAEIPFGVHVWDFTLPDENHVAAIYDVRLGRGGKLWGKKLDEAYPEIVRFMAERRLCPDTVRPAPVIKYQQGKAVADFTQFDKAAKWYFDELKLPYAYTPWQFYLFGWGHPPAGKFGVRPYPGEPPYEGADRSRLRPEFKKAYQACLKLFWDHLKEKGWHKKIILYISDEPFDRQEHIRTQMKALCDMIHEVDPEIPIYSSTWKHVPDWDGYLDVWGIGHYGRVPVEQMEKLRAAGDRIWFTTDGQMCTDTPYCAVERLLPHYCFKYGAEAYEFWGVGWLTYDPYRFGWHAYIHQTMEPGKSIWVRYPNGDGFLLYPGRLVGHSGPVSSIRLEQAREGVEDYEYLYLLRSLTAKAKAAGKDVGAAEQAMAAAAQLVSIPNAGGRYSTKILPDPDAVLEVRKSVAEAIEGLIKR